MLFRIVFGLAGILLWFLALRNISLGQATALFQSSVLFVTLASPLVLSERVGPFRMGAVLVGMVGMSCLRIPSLHR